MTRPPNVWLAALLVVGAAARGQPTAALSNTYRSASALATAVLRGFEQRNPDALRVLTLTEQEFEDHVWPELPSARPERNLPFSYVWGDLRQKSDMSLAQTLSSKGGQRYELVDVRFAGGTTNYATYRVHRRTELVVRDQLGAIETVRLFGSTLEKEGTFKVFSYVVD